MARWIKYWDMDDGDMEIGRPLIRASAKRHQAHVPTPGGRLPSRGFVILRQPGGVIMRRYATRAEAPAEVAELPRRYAYEIREQ
ncbi:hypothetical protein [Solirubrobacter pauli]|nr:hypothetical protein [Solirubrobacter pauli]